MKNYRVRDFNYGDDLKEARSFAHTASRMTISVIQVICEDSDFGTASVVAQYKMGRRFKG